MVKTANHAFSAKTYFFKRSRHTSDYIILKPVNYASSEHSSLQKLTVNLMVQNMHDLLGLTNSPKQNMHLFRYIIMKTRKKSIIDL